MPFQQSILVTPSMPHPHSEPRYSQAYYALARHSKDSSTPAILPSSPLRQLPLPSRIQRQASDKTAIVSAAQTLLSLTPPWNTSSTTTSLPTHNSRQDDHIGYSNKISVQDMGIPELADDICHKTHVHLAPTKRITASQDRPDFSFLGSTSLSLPEDEEFLSPMHCFMRKYCVEAFANDIMSEATKSTTYSRRLPLGQVGIRCLFCKDQPDTKRRERAICFPSSLPNIYHSVETWQRRHARVCPHIPVWIRRELHQLKSQSRSGAGGRRHYWVTSAQRIGLVEVEHGLRFSHPPGVLLDLTFCPRPQEKQEESQVGDETVSSSCLQSDNLSLVKSEERFMVTNYLFVLMEQMEVCYFAEQDRKGTRSKNNTEHALGFPGMQCRHCGGKAGCGRYFPITLRALTSANSDRNLWNHLKKCRKCPGRVREQLEHLQLQSSDETNRRGSRKQFFANVWHRLHGTGSRAEDPSHAVNRHF